jgi:enoyl-[acyl-carrier protein] reductase II
MLRTPLCDVLGIEYPVIQAAMGSCTSADMAAATANAGGLGSIATLSRDRAAILRDLSTIRSLTDKPFAINFVPQSLDEAAFEEALALKPAVISFALGDPGELVLRAKWAGAKTMLQVTTVEQAELAAERQIDVIIAQGTEAGGFGGQISTMVLVPQVVDAVAPIPVVAAGGIFDGRGLAAALALGAVGVNMGTRFVASRESPASDAWKIAILAAQSQDAIKAGVLNVLDPNPGTEGFGTVLRSLRTPFLDEWNDRLDDASTQVQSLIAETGALHEAGRGYEVVLTAGQGAGAIRELKSIETIIGEIVSEAESVLEKAAQFVTP